MDIFSILTLFGGLAMFLYGMRVLGDNLKENSSGTLKNAIGHITNNVFTAFLLGLGITVVIQSSTATIVITSGLVAAGIISLKQSLGIIVGANVGTTITGQIIRLLDIDGSSGSFLQFFRPSTLAPIALIIGIILIMAGKTQKRKSMGNMLMGFGILFMGLITMTEAVSAFSDSPMMSELLTNLGDNPVMGYLLGLGVSFVLQSSSAAVGILQAFSVSGLLLWKAVYPIILGIFMGDCVTTWIVCAIGAKADQKRVGVINILFNIGKTLLVILVVTILHSTGVLDGLWNSVVDSGSIANTNTVFNLVSAIVFLPLLGKLESLSRKLVKDDKVPANPYQEKLDSLSPTFFSTPALALNSCYDTLLTMFRASRKNIDRSASLLRHYDEKVEAEIHAEENNIDTMTDRVSRYIVELLPHLSDELHVSIMDQYYKVASEFERLGDCAWDITRTLRDLNAKGKNFSETALQEIEVYFELTDDILGKTELAFEKRDLNSAFSIEPLEHVAKDFLRELKRSHLQRVSKGDCDVLLDLDFVNLITIIKRISAICSNIGEATVIRVKPELADREHDYFHELHTKHGGEFEDDYNRAYDYYFGKLATAEAPDEPAALPAEQLS